MDRAYGVKKMIFAHENMKKQPSKVARNSQPIFFSASPKGPSWAEIGI